MEAQADSMENISDKIDSYLSHFEALTDIFALDKSVANDCIDILKLRKIQQIIETKDFSDKNVEFLADLAIMQGYTAVDNDPIPLMVLLINEARARSHGSVSLYNFLVSNEIYSRLEKNSQNAKEIRIMGRKVIKSDSLDIKNIVIGLCDSKFRFNEPDLLIISGQIINGE